MTEIIGWLSSVILVITLAQQNWKQWRSGSVEGVSKWLWVGQTAASTGFTVYSGLVHNWVFVTTNGLLLLNGLVGYAIVRHHRRHAKKKGDGEAAGAQPA
jgi:MtN3 and saliva related transmembrane protein